MADLTCIRKSRVRRNAPRDSVTSSELILVRWLLSSRRYPADSILLRLLDKQTPADEAKGSGLYSPSILSPVDVMHPIEEATKLETLEEKVAV